METSPDTPAGASDPGCDNRERASHARFVLFDFIE
jgi:hypothetical protein